MAVRVGANTKQATYTFHLFYTLAKLEHSLYVCMGGCIPDTIKIVTKLQGGIITMRKKKSGRMVYISSSILWQEYIHTNVSPYNATTAARTETK